jgi:hypothetical protein
VPQPASQGAGLLSVTRNAEAYKSGEVIDATIVNGLAKPVYTEDFKTACTVVILQRKQADSWTDILGCRLGRPTATVVIGPHQSQTVSLDPHSFHLTGGATTIGFGPGTYRIKFAYRTEPELGGDDPFAAYSPEFGIS